MKKIRWTNAELLTLGDLYREGLSYNAIACRLNRTKPAIAYALNKYRDVINVEYRRDPDDHLPEPPLFARPRPDQQKKVEPSEDAKKPWWKIW